MEESYIVNMTLWLAERKRTLLKNRVKKNFQDILSFY